MSLIWEELEAERLACPVTWRGRTFAVHVNPNELTEDAATELQAAVAAITAAAPADAPDAPTISREARPPSPYDGLIVKFVKEWDFYQTRTDEANHVRLPVTLDFTARLHYLLKVQIFLALITGMMAPDPEVSSPSSLEPSGSPASTILLPAGGASGTPSAPPVLVASIPAS